MGECRGKGSLWDVELKMQFLLFLKTRPNLMSISGFIYVKWVLLYNLYEDRNVYAKHLIFHIFCKNKGYGKKFMMHVKISGGLDSTNRKNPSATVAGNTFCLINTIVYALAWYFRN